MRLPSVMPNQSRFAIAPQVSVPRSQFDMDFGCKTTFQADYLVPVFCEEVLPGDTFNLKMTAFARMATPLYPLMDRLFLESFFFFVPNRLVWNNWERFNGHQDDPDDSTDFIVPVLTPPTGGFVPGSLADFFGLPIGIAGGLTPSPIVLPFRAYNLIYNDWFRAQDLQDSVPVPKGDGPDLNSDFPLLRRNKRHDYFTSCLPFPQKGPSVSIPIGSQAPVYGDGKSLGLTVSGSDTYGLSSIFLSGNGPVFAGYTGSYDQPVGSALSGSITAANKTLGVVTSGSSGLFADLTDATSATINDFRLAFMAQVMYERDARGGTRYTEILKSHFGVISPDYRLQRSEYLGGGSTPITIHSVPQTGPSDYGAGVVSSTPKGSLSAFGTCLTRSHGFVKSFTEHGFVIGLINVRADLTYQQCMKRMWSRSTRFDYYWPSLAHLGEQAILSKEIYCDGSASDNDVFGYQERYAEYRFNQSLITNQFRSNHPTSLDLWHLSEDFGSRPVLGDQFIETDTPMSRVQALSSDPNFLLDVSFDFKAARPMPVYSVPAMLGGHF